MARSSSVSSRRKWPLIWSSPPSSLSYLPATRPPPLLQSPPRGAAALCAPRHLLSPRLRLTWILSCPHSPPSTRSGCFRVGSSPSPSPSSSRRRPTPGPPRKLNPSRGHRLKVDLPQHHAHTHPHHTHSHPHHARTHPHRANSHSHASMLSQSYAFWRSVLTLTRRVQGRLNDIGMLCASAAERDANGDYTEDARAMLGLLARYVRAYSMFLYGSYTSRFAILRTPRGLGAVLLPSLRSLRREPHAREWGRWCG